MYCPRVKSVFYTCLFNTMMLEMVWNNISARNISLQPFWLVKIKNFKKNLVKILNYWNMEWSTPLLWTPKIGKPAKINRPLSYNVINFKNKKTWGINFISVPIRKVFHFERWLNIMQYLYILYMITNQNNYLNTWKLNFDDL